MDNQSFSTTITVNKPAQETYDAINNVRGWWSKEITGDTVNLNGEFNYHYSDVHRCTMKIIESIPAKKIVWLCTDNYFSFTADKKEWIGTHIIFDLTEKGDTTEVVFTHEGLVPAYECYGACVNGWTQYITQSLPALINTGEGQPNARETAYTPHEVAARFHELAQQEKWFEIQDELFADDVKSIDPEGSPYFGYAEGKAAVRKKGEDWVKRITGAHRRFTTAPVVGGNHFAVGREVDIDVTGFGRVQINEVMMYGVRDGKIVSEQFFY